MTNEKENNFELYAQWINYLFDETSDMVFIKDSNLVYVACSKSFALMAGWQSKNDIIGKTDFDVFEDKELASKYVEDDKRMIASGENLSPYIEPITKEAGMVRYCSTTKGLLKDKEGKIIGLYGVGRDVTTSVSKEHDHIIYERDLELQSVMASNTAVMLLVDATEWSVIRSWSTGKWFSNIFEDFSSIEDLFEIAANSVLDDLKIKHFFSTLSKDEIVKLYNNNRTIFSFNYLRQFSPSEQYWVHEEIRILKDPITQHILIFFGISEFGSSKSSEEAFERERIANAILNRFIIQDYEIFCLLNIHTGLLSNVLISDDKVVSKVQDGASFLDSISFTVSTFIAPGYRELAKEQFTIKNIQANLKSKSFYYLSYPIWMDGGDTRFKRWRFCWLNSECNSIVITREDITKEHYSQYDQLTGLFHRRSFVVKCLEYLMKGHPDTLSLICVNINNFKFINEHYGFGRGDEELRFVADNLRKAICHDGGFACHDMADYFFVLAHGEKEEICRKIKTFEEYMHGRVSFYPIQLRYGVYVIDDISLDFNRMIDRTVLAQSSIKNNAIVNIAFFDEQMLKRIMWEQEIISELPKAIEERQFKVWFQPQINYATKEIFGAEALVRWQHPIKGLIMPDSFIKVFERNGRISDVDKYVWEETCRLLRKWLDSHGDFITISVSVNISRADLKEIDVVNTLKKLVQRYNIPPSLLRLEITESAYMDNHGSLLSTVKLLQEAGFEVEMDDFGSGYSSLNTLKDVPVDLLKLDMEFLSNSDNNERSGNILSSVIRMAHWLKLPIMAEGVETKEQADYLKSLNCFYMQGYYFSPPMPQEQFELYISKHQKGNLMSYANVNMDGISEFWNPSAQYSLLFNSLVGGAAICECYNGNVEIIRANDEFFKELNFTRQLFESYLIHFQNLFDDDNKQEFLKMFEVTKEYLEDSCELSFSFPQSKNIVWLKFRTNFLAANGNTYLVYLTVDNISETKELRDSLIVENERAHLMVELFEATSFEYDCRTDLLSYTFRHKYKGFVSVRFKDYIANIRQYTKVRPDFLDRYVQYFIAATQEASSGSYEYVADFFDSGYCWCRSKWISMADERGSVYRVFGITVNIDEEKRMKNEG